VLLAGALAALAWGAGCGSERAEPGTGAIAPEASPGAGEPAAALPDAPRSAAVGEEAPPTAAGEPAATAEADAPAWRESARAVRQAREAASPEERRAVWRRRLKIPEDPAERARLRELAAEQDRVLVAQIDSEDPALRLEAVSGVDLRGPGRERVFALAVEDPLALVRAAAFERLYEEEAATARPIAQRGLADREPEVVLAAIGVLGVVGDASNVAELEQLAAYHADERVREAAAEAADFLR